LIGCEEHGHGTSLFPRRVEGREGRNEQAQARHPEKRQERKDKKVTSRKQAVAIGLSEARKKGKKVPRRNAR
jgi:hypothetical protein